MTTVLFASDTLYASDELTAGPDAAAVVPTTLTPGSATTDPAPTAADTVTCVLAAGVPLEEVVVRVDTTSAPTSLTVAAGAVPPDAGQAEITAVCPVGTHWFGPFTSARFAQADGSLQLVSATPANQTITAFRIPRTA